MEQAVIDEYQAAVDDQLVKYIETVRDNKGEKIERFSLKPVADRAAKDIMRLTGVDVSGNQTAIEARIVEHILKRHGENGTANHSMRDINDIARIQYVLDNYDTASYGGKTQAYQTIKPNGRPGQANTVIFIKAVNGTYYVVEAVPDTKKKKVFIASAYMSNQKAGDVQTADADAWRVTSETKNAHSPAVEAKTSTKDIIVQSGKNYHNNFQASLETGNIGERSSKGAPLGGAVERSETEGRTTAATDQAAKTDPAAAARRQQYQTEIAAALRAGDYQLALKLFKEYGNPNLRALNEVQTLKAFTEFANGAGYGVSTVVTKEQPSIVQKKAETKKLLENSASSSAMNLPDVPIGSLGAKLRDYEVMELDTGEMFRFVEGSRLQNVKVFAGKGTKVRYNNVWKYAQYYGGNEEDWQHVKGFGLLETWDGDRRAEVHWSQCNGIGLYDFFVKRWLE